MVEPQKVRRVHPASPHTTIDAAAPDPCCEPGVDRGHAEQDNLAEFTLPDGLDAGIADGRVSRSRIKGKEIVVTGAPGLDLTPIEVAALKWELAALASANSAGKEWRAVLPLGPGDSPPVGQVIFGYDDRLNARATLVGRGVATGGHPEDIADQAVREGLAQYGLSTHLVGE